MRRLFLTICALSLGMLGLIASSAGAAIFNNPNPIKIPANGTPPSNPYPSTIPVSGQPGTVAKVRVILGGVNFEWPLDVDALLVGPGGQRSILISDACGTGVNAFIGRTFTIDDAATQSFPMNPPSPCLSGTYKPTDHTENADPFGPAAPPGPHPVGLFNLIGGQVNGNWNLFVVDDFPPADDGSIASWSLELLPTAQCGKKTAFEPTHVGTAGPDRLVGTPARDVMLGLGGNDVMLGLAGNDVMCGGKGKDLLKGGPGNDNLLGQAAKDRLIGGKGKKDRCNGGAKADKAKGCEKEKKI